MGLWGPGEGAPGGGPRRGPGDGGEEGRGGGRVTWRNARIISAATEGGRAGCCSGAGRRREAAPAWVSGPFSEACGLLGGDAAAGRREVGAGRARPPGNNPHAHGGWPGTGDQDAGKVLLDRGARRGEAGSMGGEGGGGKWRVVRGHCHDAGAGSALRFLEGTLSISRPSPPPQSPPDRVAGAGLSALLAPARWYQGGDVEESLRAAGGGKAWVLEESSLRLKAGPSPPSSAPPPLPPLSRRRGGGRRGRRRCRAKRSRIGSPRLSTA